MELILENLDLLFSGFAISATVILGFTVFYSNTKHSTNRTFLFLAFATALWGFYNYFLYQVTDPDFALWALRLQALFAVAQAYFILEFFIVYPDKEYTAPKFFKNIVRPFVVAVGVITLTPLMFSEVLELAPGGGIVDVVQEPLFILFGLTNLSLVLGAGYTFLLKLRKLKEDAKRPLFLIAAGAGVTFGMIIIFNMVLPAALNISEFVPYGAVYFLPLITGMTFAILRHKLLDVKVAVAQILILFLLVFLLFRTVVSTTEIEKLFGIVALLGTLVVGVFLIRSVINEIKTREKVEKLAKDLQVANEKLKELDRQKSEFVSIASHQLRSPITAIRGYISLILENEFGKYPETLKEPLHRIAESSRLMIKSIEDYLNISRIEQGRMKYEMSEFDLADLTKTVVTEYGPVAEKKGLDLTFTGAGKILVNADIGKIKQVIANLVDNSIKYTPAGSVSVKATSFEGKARITVSDTGVGLAKEDIGDLFNKFIRARGANKINTSGTGLGLYVAKQMIEAHKGKIWAESDGKGKGSRFIFELPLTS